MALNTPGWAANPRATTAVLSAANTNLDGSTGTRVDLIAAGGLGTKVERIVVKAVAAVTAGMIRIWLHDGTNARLFKERPVAATTPSATVSSFEDLVDFSGPDGVLVVPPGSKLQVSTEKAENFHVHAVGGDIPSS